VIAMTPVAVMTLSSADGSIPGLQTARSFLAMLNDRSPGQRTEGELVKSKARVVVDLPAQRALGKVREPMPEEFAEALAPPLPEVLAIAPDAPVFEIAAFKTPGGSAVPLGAGGGGGGGGGGGDDEDPPGQPPQQEPPTVQSVPEPGTWAMLLLGFGMTGWTIRLRRRRDKQSSYA